MTRCFAAVLIAATCIGGCGENDAAHARMKSQGHLARGDGLVRSTATPAQSLRIIETLPHDTTAYTQGLLVHDGAIYESTGLYGSSSLRRVVPHSGVIQRLVRLPRELFGEGVAILGDRLYQLTWKSGIALVYDVATLTLRDTVHYRGEGWGLTAYGDSLIMSDGTSRLRVIDPATFRVLRTIDVVDLTPVTRLNELEHIDGEIWANVWGTTWIARIDPATGRVRRWVDASSILHADPRGSDQNPANGIAYDSASRRILITGKRWAHIYAVEVQ